MEVSWQRSSVGGWFQLLTLQLQDGFKDAGVHVQLCVQSILKAAILDSGSHGLVGNGQSCNNTLS